MNTLIKYLSSESIENMVTCLNYKFDKVIFYGAEFTIADERKNTICCLKDYCGVKEVVFNTVSQKNLDKTVSTIKRAVEKERSNNNQVFFDTTGGEGLALVAFGLLSETEHVPMHLYDVENQKVYLLNETEYNLLNTVEQQNVSIDLERYILWEGGKINMILHKGTKGINNPAFEKDIQEIFEVSSRYANKWSYFCIALSKVISSNDRTLHVCIPDLKSILVKMHIISQEMCAIFNELKNKGMLENAVITEEKVEFDFKSDEVKAIFVENGTILELYTYLWEKQKSDDCRVGVHLDWDGEIHPYGDVLNEIDVLSIKGYVPTFISCKSGHFDKNALYELDTVARRFGGKYTKKKLVCMCDLEKALLERANELKIEIIDGRKL